MTDAALGLYIHWPYCARICPYCDFNVYRARGMDDALFSAIMEDLDFWAGKMSGRKLVSIHFGGGTPSLLTAGQISALIERASERFGFDTDVEIGLEANPNDYAGFADFAGAGINRLSLGVQSFQDDALIALGRDHDGQASRKALDGALGAFERVSIDLIYAREGQNLKDWEKELSDTLTTGLDHLSLYQLTIEPGTAFDKRVARGDLIPPGENLAEQLFRLTQSICAAQGLEPYEISNHARRGSESRHNRLYWEGGDWIGIGPGAHGRIGSYTAGGRASTDTALRPTDYMRRVSESGTGSTTSMLSALDEARERILMGMRISDGVDLAQLENLTGLSVDQTEVERYTEQGWLFRMQHRLAFTSEGRLLADGIAAAICP